MPKNQKSKTPIEFVPLDYKKIIDNYSEEAFKLCVAKLFPLFELKVLTVSDIRPVDLKEQVMQLTEALFPSPDGQPNLSTWLYREGLYDSYDLLVHTAEGSRAQKYETRAKELLSQATKGEQIMEKLEDAIVIFVASLKPLRGHIASADNKCVEEPDFTISIADLDIIEEVWNLIYEEITSTRQGFFRKRDNSDAISYFKYCYINNIMLFCRILQERGVFTSEVE